jgi:MFS family permease
MKREPILRELSFLKGNLLVLLASYTVFGLVSGLYEPFRSLYIRDLGASPLVLGLLSSLSSIILALIRLPGAYIADKHGRRRVIVIFTFGAALSYGFYVIAHDWRLIAVAVIVSALSHIYQPALEAIEADSMPPEKRGLGYIIVYMLPGVPCLFAPAVSGWAVESMGLVPGMRIVYAAIFVLALLVAGIRWRYLKETMPDAEELGLSHIGEAFRLSLGSIRDAWASMGREIWFLAAFLVLFSFENPLFGLYLALYASDVAGVTGFQWGLIASLGTVVMLLLGLPVGRMVDGLGRRRSLLLAYLFSTPVLLSLGHVKGFTLMALAFVSFMVCNTLRFPAYSALQADLIPKDRRGRVMGLMGTLRNLAMVPAATVFGYLYQVNPVYPFYLGAAVELLAVGIILFLIKEPSWKH